MLSRRSFLQSSSAALAAKLLLTFAASAARDVFPVQLSDFEWRRRLSAASYAVLRRHGTERPGSSPLDREKRRGTYNCAGCRQPLFSSATKFDSGSGWPSFYAPLGRALGSRPDQSAGFARTEVHCARCGGHLGHVFDDGPRPTGKRYCINGAALGFRAG
jgi:peptide-methionine (R)-S-oxide reductase